MQVFSTESFWVISESLEQTQVIINLFPDGFGAIMGAISFSLSFCDGNASRQENKLITNVTLNVFRPVSV